MLSERKHPVRRKQIYFIFCYVKVFSYFFIFYYLVQVL